MAVDSLPHGFDRGAETLSLWVRLPAPSMEGLQLEVAWTEVRLTLGGEKILLPLPAEMVEEVAGEAVAKFSKKSGKLTVTWPREVKAAAPKAEAAPAEVKADAPKAEAAPAEVKADAPKAEAAPAEAAAPKEVAAPAEAKAAAPKEEAAPAEVKAAAPKAEAPAEVKPAPETPKAEGKAHGEAYGSIWNKNSWHWEEKNCMDLATAEVRRALAEWKHVPELSGASIQFREIQVSGDASFALRKGKRLLCYELTVKLKWEGRDEFGHTLGVKGAAKVSGVTPEDDEEIAVQLEVSSGSSKSEEAKAAAHWMKGEGARRLRARLAPEVLREAILGAEVAQAQPEKEKARRALEEQRAAEARHAAAAEQQRISEEAKQRELKATRPEVSGSVWNVNAWHWEEKPMTEWSIQWLSREMPGMGLRIMSGLAEVEFRDVQVSGDASVSVRKGKPILLYLLRVECRWEASADVGEAQGALVLPEFSSEDGPKGSLIQVETAKDSSRGRLSAAMRKEGVAALRALLVRFEENLRSQLK